MSDCNRCIYRPRGNGGWCYIFRVSPGVTASCIYFQEATAYGPVSNPASSAPDTEAFLLAAAVIASDSHEPAPFGMSIPDAFSGGGGDFGGGGSSGSWGDSSSDSGSSSASDSSSLSGD